MIILFCFVQESIFSVCLSLIIFFNLSKLNKNSNYPKQDSNFTKFPQHVDTAGLHSTMFENTRSLIWDVFVFKYQFYRNQEDLWKRAAETQKTSGLTCLQDALIIAITTCQNTFTVLQTAQMWCTCRVITLCRCLALLPLKSVITSCHKYKHCFFSSTSVSSHSKNNNKRQISSENYPVAQHCCYHGNSKISDGRPFTVFYCWELTQRVCWITNTRNGNALELWEKESGCRPQQARTKTLIHILLFLQTSPCYLLLKALRSSRMHSKWNHEIRQESRRVKYRTKRFQ